MTLDLADTVKGLHVPKIHNYPERICCSCGFDPFQIAPMADAKWPEMWQQHIRDLIAQATADALEAAAQDLDAKSIEWEDKRDESNESLVSYNYGYFSGLTEGFRVSAAKIRALIPKLEARTRGGKS